MVAPARRALRCPNKAVQRFGLLVASRQPKALALSTRKYALLLHRLMRHGKGRKILRIEATRRFPKRHAKSPAPEGERAALWEEGLDMGEASFERSMLLRPDPAHLSGAGEGGERATPPKAGEEAGGETGARPLEKSTSSSRLSSLLSMARDTLRDPVAAWGRLRPKLAVFVFPEATPTHECVFIDPCSGRCVVCHDTEPVVAGPAVEDCDEESLSHCVNEMLHAHLDEVQRAPPQGGGDDDELSQHAFDELHVGGGRGAGSPRVYDDTLGFVPAWLADLHILVGKVEKSLESTVHDIEDRLHLPHMDGTPPKQKQAPEWKAFVDDDSLLIDPSYTFVL